MSLDERQDKRHQHGRNALLALGCALMTAVATPAHAAESVYAALDLDACAVLDQSEEGASVLLQCDGLPGYPVFASEGDLRFDVDFGARNDVWESFGPFNSIHDTVEWRVAAGDPHAAILRYFIDTGMTGGPDDKGQVLVVSKVGTQGAPGCVVALVDVAVEQANGVARGAAAMAPDFACGASQPVAIGPTSSFAFSFTNMRPEGE